MKKRIYLLTTLILSLFVFSGRVEADTLKCLYENKYLLIQEVSSSNVAWSFYYCNQGLSGNKCDFNSPSEHWDISSSEGVNFEDTIVYDDKSGKLNECPPYYSPSGVSVYEKFYDEKKWNRVDYELTDSQENTGSNKENIKFFGSSSEYEDQIKNTDWNGVCTYGIGDGNNFTLYFNKDDYILASNSDKNNVEFSLNDLLFLVNNNYYNGVYNCPIEIYVRSVNCLGTQTTMSANGEFYYLEAQKEQNSNIYGCEFSTVKYPYLEGNVVNFGPIKPQDPGKLPIDDCASLFGEDLIKQINKVMNIVKIVVPILLIGFGIFDFTKAIFSGNEDNMAKSKKTFFRRIIAAVLVFVAPIFINLILSLANEVWGYIIPDTCINETK